MWRTTLSGDLSNSGFVDPLLEASSSDSFQADLGESGKALVQRIRSVVPD